MNIEMTEEGAKTKLCCGPDGCGTRKERCWVEDGKDCWVIERVCAGAACMGWLTDTPAGNSSEGRAYTFSTCKYGHCGLIK